jgi:hypothetical protein
MSNNPSTLRSPLNLRGADLGLDDTYACANASAYTGKVNGFSGLLNILACKMDP